MPDDLTWINAGTGESVGTVTIDTDGWMNLAAHGLEIGQPVEFENRTGGASNALRLDTTYYVIHSETDRFRVASNPADSIITFASSGTADVNTRVPHYSARTLRQIDGGLLVNDTSDRFGARSGVHPSDDPVVTVSGTTATVEDCRAVVYPAENSAQGPYRIAVQSEDVSLDPADGSNDRIDALDLEVQDDDEDASGFRRYRVVYTAGTPAGSPSAPSLTAGRLRLATILVPSGGSPSPSVSDDAEPPYYTAVGGVLPVRDDSEGPDAGRYVGMFRYRRDAEVLEVWDGSAWMPSAGRGGWFPIAAGQESGVASFDIDLTDGGRFPVGTFSSFKLRAVGRGKGSTEVQARINDIATGVYRRSTVRIEDDNTVNGSRSTGGPQWFLTEWGGGAGTYNPLEFTLMIGGGNDDVVTGQWNGTDVDRLISTFGGGKIDAAVFPAKITLMVGGGAATEFNLIRWECEGYLPPDYPVPSS